jgi:hypothetical protein
MDELKQGNIILSGARGANPWLELYEPQMNFSDRTMAFAMSIASLTVIPRRESRIDTLYLTPTRSNAFSAY